MGAVRPTAAVLQQQSYSSCPANPAIAAGVPRQRCGGAPPTLRTSQTGQTLLTGQTGPTGPYYVLLGRGQRHRAVATSRRCSNAAKPPRCTTDLRCQSVGSLEICLGRFTGIFWGFWGGFYLVTLGPTVPHVSLSLFPFLFKDYSGMSLYRDCLRNPFIGVP